MILAFLINHESITKAQLICMIGAFSGIIVLSLSSKDQKSPNNVVDTKIVEEEGPYKKQEPILILGLICIGLNVLSFSSLAVLIRKLQNIHFSMINFHYGYFAVILCLLFLVI